MAVASRFVCWLPIGRHHSNLKQTTTNQLTSQMHLTCALTIANIKTNWLARPPTNSKWSKVQCPLGTFPCHVCPDICIEQWRNCDGVADCPYGTDERESYCRKCDQEQSISICCPPRWQASLIAARVVGYRV